MASKRRGHGEGSIYQRKDGRWCASFKTESGKRVYLYGKTRKEVVERLREAQQEHKQGILATGPHIKLGTYLSHWLETVYKPSVKLGSYANTQLTVRNHLQPGLGGIALRKLTTTHIQNFYADKLKDGYSAKTIALMHSTLRKALDSAVRDGMVARNVAALVTHPRLTPFDAHILSVEEARRLIDTARGSKLEALIILAITTGLRKGELLALRWQDVDLQEGVLYVRRTVNRYGKYGMIVSEPKTKSSRRRIVLAEIAVNALKVHYEVQKQRKEAARDIWEENNLVFCNRSGKYLLPETFHKQFKNLLRKAGLPDIRLHDLRHSAASLLLAMGVHPKVVQELLGHSSISTTLDVYSHVIPSLQREASEKMHNLLQIRDESVGKDEI